MKAEFRTLLSDPCEKFIVEILKVEKWSDRDRPKLFFVDPRGGFVDWWGYDGDGNGYWVWVDDEVKQEVALQRMR